MNEFIRFVKSIFPCLHGFNVDDIAESIKQFHVNPEQSCLTTRSISQSLIQGDIISDIPFITIDDNGELLENRFRGMIISNSCDIENDITVVVAPLYPLSEMKNINPSRINNIKKNLTYSILYFNDTLLQDFFVDFSRLTTFNKDFLLNAVKEQRVQRLYSLSIFGYYLFLCKLAVHFMRPENQELASTRPVL